MLSSCLQFGQRNSPVDPNLGAMLGASSSQLSGSGRVTQSEWYHSLHESQAIIGLSLSYGFLQMQYRTVLDLKSCRRTSHCFSLTTLKIPEKLGLTNSVKLQPTSISLVNAIGSCSPSSMSFWTSSSGVTPSSSMTCLQVHHRYQSTDQLHYVERSKNSDEMSPFSPR